MNCYYTGLLLAALHLLLLYPCKAEFIVDNGDDDGAGLKPTLPRWRSLDEVSGVAGVGVPLVLTGICGGDDNELLTAGL